MLQCIQRHSVNLSEIVCITLCGIMYGCDDQVPTNLCPHCVYLMPPEKQETVQTVQKFLILNELQQAGVHSEVIESMSCSV